VRFAILLVAAPGIVACSPPSSFVSRYSAAPATSSITTMNPEHDRVTANELSSARATAPDAYSALRLFRPLFFTTRPSGATLRGEVSQIHVVIDGNYSGDVDVLKLIPTTEVASIRRVQAEMITVPIGQVHAGDTVLMVTLRQR
jgi:hypothetical protein